MPKWRWSQAANLSENKLKPDSMTLALFYELKGEPERAAAELESYMKKTPQLKNSEPLQNEIKRLREKARKPIRKRYSAKICG